MTTMPAEVLRKALGAIGGVLVRADGGGGRAMAMVDVGAEDRFLVSVRRIERPPAAPADPAGGALRCAVCGTTGGVELEVDPISELLEEEQRRPLCGGCFEKRHERVEALTARAAARFDVEVGARETGEDEEGGG